MAPEAMEPGFDQRVDVWGIGVICYMLLTSSNVFLDEEQFNQGTWSISTELDYSIECLRFLNEALQHDREMRPFPDTIKEHPFLRCNLQTQLTIRERLSGIKAKKLRCTLDDDKKLCFNSKDPSVFEELYKFWTGDPSYSVLSLIEKRSSNSAQSRSQRQSTYSAAPTFPTECGVHPVYGATGFRMPSDIRSLDDQPAVQFY